MKLQIIDKLKAFLSDRPLLKEEYEVVYLMVELRKLLDRERQEVGSEEFSLIRFHADWIVHTRKDYVTSTMKKIMKNIDDSIDVYPKNGNIDFLLLPEFRKEMINILKEYNLPNLFAKDDDKWMKFMLAMTQVVADQPIINPTENIAEFRYVDMNKEGIMATIDFCGSKTGSSITLGFGI